MITFAVLVLFIVGGKTTITCNRSGKQAGKCQIISTSLLTVTHTCLFNASQQEYLLHDIKGVTIDTSYSGRSGTYRVCC